MSTQRLYIPRRAFAPGRRLLLLVLVAAAVAGVAWPVDAVVARLARTADVGSNTLATGAWTNVQTGVATSTTNGSFTVPIASVDPAKSFLVFNVRSNASRPGDSVVRGRILDATTLEFTRATDTASPPTITIRWYVASFASGVSVQRGETTLSAPNLTNVAITSVASTSQAFVLFSTTPAASDNAWDSNNSVAAELTSTNNLQLRYTGAGSGVVSWAVVEFTNAEAINVQRGTTSMSPASATSTTVTLPTAVDTSKTLVLVSHTVSGGNTAHVGARVLRAQLTNSTTITIDRDVSGTPSVSIPDIAWQAIELKNPSGDPTGPSVQRGSAAFASGTAQASAAISSVVTDRAVAFATVQSGTAQSMGKTPYTTDDVLGVATATVAVGASSVTLDRDSTAAAADVGWAVVQFPAKQP